jgi:hypothetical protein
MVQEPVENNTHGWIELDISELDPLDDTSPVPFRLVANRFTSSSPDSEDFIHDPLTALQQAQQNEGILEGLDLTGWKVTTHIINHHQTLSARHLYAMAAVDQDEQAVGVTLVKKHP